MAFAIFFQSVCHILHKPSDCSKPKANGPGGSRTAVPFPQGNCIEACCLEAFAQPEPVRVQPPGSNQNLLYFLKLPLQLLPDNSRVSLTARCTHHLPKQPASNRLFARQIIPHLVRMLLQGL